MVRKSEKTFDLQPYTVCPFCSFTSRKNRLNGAIDIDNILPLPSCYDSRSCIVVVLMKEQIANEFLKIHLDLTHEKKKKNPIGFNTLLIYFSLMSILSAETLINISSDSDITASV